METLERIIAEHPYLSGIDPQWIELLSGCAANRKYEPGSYIFREGQEANEFFLVRSGRIAVEMAMPNHDPITVATVLDGDVLGWSWLLPPYQWKFQGRVVEPTRVFALDGKCLRQKCEANHDLGYELLKRFCKIIDRRLDQARFQLLDVYAVAR
ncbi:MAG TPA: cyclic nucleotide-binding domain-containing protein [Terriglobales bacterium]|jgi:CRP-like cAMP-binding protein|nr:cyclic nucleotide-binding domain-containing protein [Terriglobales bacterium]